MAASLSGITVAPTNQNAGSVSVPGDTIFASDKVTSLTLTLVESTGVSCGTGTTWSAATSNVSVYEPGTAACTTNPNDFFEEITWMGVPSTGLGQLDTFYITTTGGASPGVAAFSISDTTPMDPAFSGQLNVFLDAGPSGSGNLPIAYTNIVITVSGT
ncbi:MAG TPA: hypothetical protein VMC82_00440 [Thermoplasmata archaeon]|nr:hypothetical protein [Thermoplasmata archaeon]